MAILKAQVFLGPQVALAFHSIHNVFHRRTIVDSERLAGIIPQEVKGLAVTVHLLAHSWTGFHVQGMSVILNTSVLGQSLTIVLKLSNSSMR